MIRNGYEPPRIVRPPSLNMYGDISSGANKLIRSGEKMAVNAGKAVLRTGLKAGTGLLPIAGKTLGAGAGILASELAPTYAPLIISGGIAGGAKLGQYAQKSLNKQIDKI